LTPFLRGHSSGGEDTASATRLGYRRQVRPRTPQGPDEPHPALMRTPAARPRKARRLCRGQRPGRSRYSFVPHSVAIQKRQAHLLEGGSRSARLTAGAGRQAKFLLLRSGGPAGVGRTWDGASAPSPYSLRQLRADLVLSPDPPPGRGPDVDHRGRQEGGRGRRPIKASGCRGYGPGHTGADSWSRDKGMSSLGLAPKAPVRPRLAGRPRTQCLTKRWTSKTSFVCSMW
jgi:hypothetical protein